MSIQVKDNQSSMLNDVLETEKVCNALMKQKHYEKMGKEGIFAIIQKANSLGIKPIEALNGGMYFVQGKVELSAITMAKLIRQQKHSITMDKNSNASICILHGKRADNGDTWKASFSVEDAKRAGLLNRSDSPWNKYPDVMCYNRALSKLARQLFPDVIGNCYIEGEISQAIEAEEVIEQVLDVSQANILEIMLNQCDEEFKKTVLNFLEQRFGAPDFNLLPAEMHETIREKIQTHLDEICTKPTVEVVAQTILKSA